MAIESGQSLRSGLIDIERLLDANGTLLRQHGVYGNLRETRAALRVKVRGALLAIARRSSGHRQLEITSSSILTALRNFQNSVREIRGYLDAIGTRHEAGHEKFRDFEQQLTDLASRLYQSLQQQAPGPGQPRTASARFGMP